MVIFIILILPVNSSNMVYLSICLCCLQFLSSVSYSLPSIIPRYFILFDAMVNRIVSFISLSDSSLLVYRNAAWSFLTGCQPCEFYLVGCRIFVHSLSIFEVLFNYLGTVWSFQCLLLSFAGLGLEAKVDFSLGLICTITNFAPLLRQYPSKYAMWCLTYYDISPLFPALCEL